MGKPGRGRAWRGRSRPIVSARKNLITFCAIPEHHPEMAKRGEVIIEFYRVGAFVKV